MVKNTHNFPRNFLGLIYFKLKCEKTFKTTATYKYGPSIAHICGTCGMCFDDF